MAFNQLSYVAHQHFDVMTDFLGDCRPVVLLKCSPNKPNSSIFLLPPAWVHYFASSDKQYATK